MKRDISFDILVLMLGILLVVVIQNSTRFLGAGFISLGITYLLIDRITGIKEGKVKIKKRNNK
ncbi:hypothetical protein [Clostridium fallax]|uniref:Uncharacterized protein n=1 Tax=Clostridium fallax TaxID=1533 RepID=A0A1M4Z1G7_9CLOT|nr:hypothetical protein [Clostridium fallax]SHF11647.1 hypothetical protein SAMN05443638_1355 [Clostridium fallax]SQB22211.1 Uncharacterised protein [Clostridium fallax]